MLKTLASTLGLLAVTVTAQTTTPLPPDTNYNVRESHENPIYINIPVPTSLLAPLVPAPLSVDEYGGTGWISVIIDNFNKLELWVPLPTWLNPDGGAFVNSGTSGFQTKIEIAVFDAERNTHGYMIHGIDFQTGASGVIRSLGAQIQQKIPSHVCDFDVDLTNYPARVPLSYACGFDDSYVRGTAAAAGGQVRARSRSQHTLKAVTAADTDVNPALAAVTPDPAFVKFIGNRVVKYVKQFDGTVVTSLETGPGSYYNFDSFTWLVDADNTTGIDSNFVQQRFPSLYAGGVTAESPCATLGRCFTVPKVVLVDHKDQPR